MTEDTKTTKPYVPSEHISKSVLNAIRVTPGIRSDALAKELSLSGATISVTTRKLMDEGLIIREQTGRMYRFYAPNAAPQLFLSGAPLLEAEIEALKAEIEELRAFKEQALAVYPDLDVDPLILKAREIVADLLPGHRKHILLGNADQEGAMRGAVATLRAIAAQKED